MKLTPGRDSPNPLRHTGHVRDQAGPPHGRTGEDGQGEGHQPDQRDQGDEG